MSVVVALSLVHFVWQGALIGATAWIAMKLARTARVRYAIGVVGIVAMAVAPMATAVAVQGARSKVQGHLSSQVPGPEVSSTSQVLSSTDGAPRTTDAGQQVTLDLGRWTLDDMSPEWAVRLMLAWILGVALLSLRLTFGFLTARRLTRVGVRAPSADVAALATQVIAALGITRAVRVLESTLVRVPTVIGWMRPVVLLPAAAMSGLSTAQIEAVIAHECAHIRRFDYLVNLFQSVVETVLFYHPAVWLLSRRVRHERELCCDDLALQVCGDRVTYASALADLEGLRALPDPALAATGGSLLTRVRRILHHDERSASSSRPNWMAGVAVLMIALLAAPNVAKPEAVDLQAVPSPVTKASVAGDLHVPGPSPVASVVAGDLQVPGAGTDPVGADLQVRAQDPGIPMLVSAADDPGMTIGDEFELVVRVSNNGKADKRFSDKPYTVAPDGKITLPLIGAFPVKGLTLAKAASGIRTELIYRKFMADPQVDVRAKMEIVEADGFASDTPADHRMTADDQLGLMVKTPTWLHEYDGPFAPNAAGQVALPKISTVPVVGKTVAEIVEAVRRRLVETRVAVNPKVDAIIITAAQRQALAQAPTTAPEQPVAPEPVQAAMAEWPAIVPGQIVRLEVNVGVIRQGEFSKNYTVQPNGKIVLPYLGELQAAGLTSGELSQRIRVALAERNVLPGAVVLATIEGIATTTSVFVVGEVKLPGAHPWKEGLRVADYVSLAGGVPSDIVPRFEVTAGEARAESTATAIVPAGATIMVAKTPSLTVTIQGAVRMPGRVVVPPNRATLEATIALAGGLAPNAGAAIRVMSGGRRPAAPAGVTVVGGWEIYSVEELREGRASSVPVFDGDTIQVAAAAKYYVNGQVKTPGEQQWEPNLTVQKALVRSGGTTPDAALNRIQVKRQDPKTKKYEDVKMPSDRMLMVIQAEDIIVVPKRRM